VTNVTWPRNLNDGPDGGESVLAGGEMSVLPGGGASVLQGGGMAGLIGGGMSILRGGGLSVLQGCDLSALPGGGLWSGPDDNLHVSNIPPCLVFVRELGARGMYEYADMIVHARGQ
jgi:hypothetical protein